MIRTPKNPSAGSPPVSRRVAQATPGGPVALEAPPVVAGGKTPLPAAPPLPQPGEAQDRENGPVPAGCPSLPGSPLEPVEPGPPIPGTAAVHDRVTAAGRGRIPRTPAVGEGASPLPSAGLQGAEWRKAAKAAEAKGRRKTTRPAATSKQAAPALSLPPPSPGSAALTATASCTGCEWTAGPGPAADVDRAAEKHVGRGHSTAVAAELRAGVA